MYPSWGNPNGASERWYYKKHTVHVFQLENDLFDKILDSFYLIYEKLLHIKDYAVP